MRFKFQFQGELERVFFVPLIFPSSVSSLRTRTHKAEEAAWANVKKNCDKSKKYWENYGKMMLPGRFRVNYRNAAVLSFVSLLFF